MEFVDFMEKSKEFENKSLTWNNNLVNAVMGLAGESGELLELVKKWRFQEHELKVDRIEEELGDVMWYVAYLIRTLRLDFGEILDKNVAKLSSRYPGGFDPGLSRDREL
jgi:NTP pyrophosphatase (non-canonical NTP hydrolase)